MKAIVLAAGNGERLRGVVDDVPKPMVKIKSRPILEHNIKLLENCGITEICVNLHHLPDVIRNHFRDGKDWGVNITYSYEPEILGTAGAVKNLEEQIGTNQFFVLYGDNLYDCNFAEIIEFHHERQGLGTVGVHERDDVSQCGVVEMDSQNKIISFVEKPGGDEITSHLVNAGIYVFEPGIFNFIPERRFSDFGSDIFPELLKGNERIYAAVLTGKLTAVDTPELLAQAADRST